MQTDASVIDRQMYFKHQVPQFVIHTAAQRSRRLAGKVVKREQTDQDSVSVDYRNAPGAVLPHKLCGGIEIVFSSATDRCSGHRPFDRQLGKRLVLGIRGHANVAVGEKTDRAALVIDHRNGATWSIPHYLRRPIE